MEGGAEQSTWERAQYRPRSQEALNRDALAAATQHTDSGRGGGGPFSRDLGLRRDFGRRPADSTQPPGLRAGTRWLVVDFAAHLLHNLQQAVFVDVSALHGRMEAQPPGGPSRRAERPAWKHTSGNPPPCKSWAWALCLLVVVALLLLAGGHFVQRHIETVVLVAEEMMDSMGMVTVPPPSPAAALQLEALQRPPQPPPPAPAGSPSVPVAPPSVRRRFGQNPEPCWRRVRDHEKTDYECDKIDMRKAMYPKDQARAIARGDGNARSVSDILKSEFYSFPSPPWPPKGPPPATGFAPPPPPLPAPPTQRQVELLFDSEAMASVDDLVALRDATCRAKPKLASTWWHWLSPSPQLKRPRWWRWEWQNALERRYCSTNWLQPYSTLFEETLRSRNMHTVLGNKKSIFVMHPSGLRGQLQGLVVGMAIGVTVDRPAFTNWKYRDAFADNAAFALSEQKETAHIGPTYVKQAAHGKLYEPLVLHQILSDNSVTKEDGILTPKDAEEMFMYIAEGEDDLTDGERMKAHLRSSWGLCRLLTDPQRAFRYSFEHKFGIRDEDADMWREARRAMALKALAGDSREERRRFANSTMGELMFATPPSSGFIDRREKHAAHEGYCTLAESCLLRAQIGLPAPALQKRLERVHAEYERCDTVVIGIHVRYGGVEFATNAESERVFKHKEERSRLDAFNDQQRKAHGMTAKQESEIGEWKEAEERHMQERITKRNGMDQRMTKKSVQLMFEWAELVGRRLAKVSRKPRVKYFIASDTSMAIYMAYARFGKDKVLVTPGKLQDTRVVDTTSARLKAASDWWLLGQSDGLILGSESGFADKAVLAAMHVPVLVRCGVDYIEENIAHPSELNKLVEGWSCRPVQIMDDVDGPRAA